MVLYFVAFLSGMLTIAAPCIWPILPVVLSSSLSTNKYRPLGVVLGIVSSFAVLTLALSYVVTFLPIAGDLLRWVAAAVIVMMGVSLLIPQVGAWLETVVGRMSGVLDVSGANTNQSFTGGIVNGLALGIAWTPCAGPILAAIAAVSATQTVTLQVVALTFAYSTGIALPLLILAIYGQRLFVRLRGSSRFLPLIQKILGALLLATGVAIFTGYDTLIQARLLDLVPAYSSGLTKLESIPAVQEQLDSLGSGTESLRNSFIGKQANVANMAESDTNKLPRIAPAPELTGITNWLNGEPTTLAELRGKVVLIDFWTYTCINCIRTLPYLKAWHESYADQGLVIIGVHSPEFAFEKSTGNVQDAIERFELPYLVAQDNDFATWRAYSNRYWPAKYLIDAEGIVRYTHFGEGDYEETEHAIQSLLEEAGAQANQTSVTPDPTAAVPYRELSPETYLGSARMERQFPHRHLEPGTNTYSLTSNENLPLSRFSLGGEWQIAEEYASCSAGAQLNYAYAANNVYLVMKPANDTEASQVTIAADQQTQAIEITEHKLYQLLEIKPEALLEGESVAKGTLTITCDSPTELYAFTFG